MMKIKYIDSKKIIFDDDREYKFLDSNPPPSSWTIKDDYEVIVRGEEKDIKREIVVNKTQENQQRMIVYSGGGVSKKYAPEDKLGKDYPDEWLDKDWSIRKLHRDGYIVIADPSSYGSKWKLGGLVRINVKMLGEGQKIQISKGTAPFKTYRIKILNTDIPQFDVSFLGWEESEFKIR